MKKVFFAFVAVATLALVSCNNNQPAAEETPAQTEETAAPAETEEVAADSTEEAATEQAPAAN